MTNVSWNTLVSKQMHNTSTVVMYAPREKIFETAADVGNWPKFLPHYRYVQYLERTGDRAMVKMSARRNSIPATWVSELVIDRERGEVRFKHLRSWTKGMDAIWTFETLNSGIRVNIEHNLHFRVPALRSIVEPVISGYFIDHIANQTLKHMKLFVENP